MDVRDVSMRSMTVVDVRPVPVMDVRSMTVMEMWPVPVPPNPGLGQCVCLQVISEGKVCVNVCGKGFLLRMKRQQAARRCMGVLACSGCKEIFDLVPSNKLLASADAIDLPPCISDLLGSIVETACASSIFFLAALIARMPASFTLFRLSLIMFDSLVRRSS